MTHIRTGTTRLVVLLLALAATQALVALPATAQPAATSNGFQTVALDQVDTPTRVAMSPDSNWVWVVDEKKKIVEVVDAHIRRTVGKWVRFPAPDPADVRSISVSVEDGWVAYIALLNGVLRVDMHNSSATVVSNAQSLVGAVATVDSTLVRTTLANGADIVDTRSGTTVPLNVSPVTARPARSADGRTAYVVGLTPPTLFPVDVRSKAVGRSWPIRVGSSGSNNKIAVSPSGRYVVTTDFGVGSILDITTGISTPVTGNAGSFLDVTYGPTDNVFYLADGPDLVRVENGIVTGRERSPATTLHNPAYNSGTATVFAGGAQKQGLIAYTPPTVAGPSLFGS